MVKICREVKEEIPKERFDFYFCRLSDINEEILKTLDKARTLFELIGRAVFLEVKERINLRRDDLITISIEKEDLSNKVIKISKDIIDDFEEGQYVLLNKGNVMGMVEEIRENSMVFRVIKEGYIDRYSDLKIFGKEFSLEVLDEKDREFIEKYSPNYCILGGIKEKSEIRKVRKEYGNVVFIPKVDTREFVQNFEDFLEGEIFLYFSREGLIKNFPLSFIQKMEMTLIKRANEEGVGSIVEVNVDDPLYKYDLYNYLMNRVDIINIVGKKIPETFYDDLKKVVEYFDFKIPKKYLSVIEFLEENSEMDRIFLDVEDIKLLSYFSKRRTWRKVFSIINECLDDRIARLFSNVEISASAEEGYPVVYEREDVLSIRIPRQRL